MNELEEGVAPTDSRNRPDQRLMEDGKWDEANQVKFLLEEKQRSARKKREADAEQTRSHGGCPNFLIAGNLLWPCIGNPGVSWKTENELWAFAKSSDCPGHHSNNNLNNLNGSILCVLQIQFFHDDQ